MKNTNKPLDGAYLADFGIGVSKASVCLAGRPSTLQTFDKECGQVHGFRIPAMRLVSLGNVWLSFWLYQSLLNKRHLVVCWYFHGRFEMQIWLKTPRQGMNCINFVQIHTSDNLFCSNSFPILELSVKCASQICHENINKPLDGAYLAVFGIDITKIQDL